MEAYSNEPPQQESTPPEKKGNVDPITSFETAVAGNVMNMMFFQDIEDIFKTLRPSEEWVFLYYYCYSITNSESTVLS